jgi:hypothetical protein
VRPRRPEPGRPARPGQIPWLAAALLGGAAIAGCAPAERRPLTPVERAIEAAARPILEMDPDAVWTDGYNRLVELAPLSIAYLAEHPALGRPVAPDDLRVLLHASLLRLLVRPGVRPALSANCFETTLDVLHFDLKVDGQAVGTPFMPEPGLPAAWHDLYPAELSPVLASRIDAEADRRTLRAWWLQWRDRPGALPVAPPLNPRSDRLWRLLARRYADVWSYQPGPRAVRCADPPGEPVLVTATTYDYNLARAACVWLGSTGDAEACDRLVNLVGSPSLILAHNAVFALQYVHDPRIRALLERYKAKREGAPPATPLIERTLPLQTRSSMDAPRDRT